MFYDLCDVDGTLLEEFTDREEAHEAMKDGDYVIVWNEDGDPDLCDCVWCTGL